MMSDSNYNCGECNANLCTHTVDHINKLSLKIHSQETRISDLLKIVDALTQIKNVGISDFKQIE